MTTTWSNSKGVYLRAVLFLVLMSATWSLGAFSNRDNQPQTDKIATYERGEEEMYQTIKKYITYPASARRENRSGLVQVSFTVNENGTVENVLADAKKQGHLLKEIVVVGYSTSSEEAKEVDEVLKAESARVVEGLGKFIPAQKDGKPVSSVLTLPIKFKLN